MKHTKGPWMEKEFMIYGDSGDTIAICKHNFRLLPKEAEANAVLIKEAPALLALCEEALEDIKTLTFRLDEYQDTGDFTMIIQDLESGIAAARGKERT